MDERHTRWRVRFAKYAVGLFAAQERPDDRIFTTASAAIADVVIYSRNGLTGIRPGTAIVAAIAGIGTSAQQERSGAHRPFDRE